jgi:hypothetical protein
MRWSRPLAVHSTPRSVASAVEITEPGRALLAAGLKVIDTIVVLTLRP